MGRPRKGQVAPARQAQTLLRRPRPSRPPRSAWGQRGCSPTGKPSASSSSRCASTTCGPIPRACWAPTPDRFATTAIRTGRKRRRHQASRRPLGSAGDQARRGQGARRHQEHQALARKSRLQPGGPQPQARVLRCCHRDVSLLPLQRSP